jgi:hypothetical protein
MVLLLLPTLNDSSPCLETDLHDALRPARSSAFEAQLIGVLVSLCCLFTLGLPGLYIYRDDPRFRKIRPFPLQVALYCVSLSYVSACLLPHLIDGFPCALWLFLHVFGATTAVSVTAVRALIFVIESQFAIAVSKEGLVVHSDSQSMISSKSHDTEDGEIPDHFLYCFREVLALGYGFRDLQSMKLETLAYIRKRYLGIFVAISIPPFVVFIIGVLSVGVYRRGCTDCPMTFDFILIVELTPSLFIFFIVRLVRLGLSMHNDEQEVMRELLLTLLLSPAWIYLGYFLDLFDPGQIQFNRLFSFEILTCIGPLVYWIMSVAVQVWKAYEYRRQRSVGDGTSIMSSRKTASVSRSFLEDIEQNSGLRTEFIRFAGARYAQELVNFLLDVRAYKRQFEANGERWRKTTARRLVNTYIRLDAPQQVNIGEALRDPIVRTDLDSNPTKVDTLFDDAFNDVFNLVTRGLWSEFNFLRAQKETAQKTNAAVADTQIFAAIQ